MNAWRTLLALIVASACNSGCGSPSTTPNGTAAAQSAAATNSETRTMTPIDAAPKVTEEALQAVEKKYSCRLPDDYRRFLLQSNGGFPSPDCVVFTEADLKTASDVFCFFAIGDERSWASLEWHCDTFSGRLPKGTLPIARDSCGNLWLLSVGSTSPGAVFFWDHGSYETFDETDLAQWPRVATNFHAFRESLIPYDANATNKAVLSRYALVKQATEGMAKKDDGFSTRANPEYAWHCDCTDGGDVRMQFVAYEVHAAVTHTDGYSRLRALKGLIKQGPPRLPK